MFSCQLFSKKTARNQFRTGRCSCFARLRVASMFNEEHPDGDHNLMFHNNRPIDTFEIRTLENSKVQKVIFNGISSIHFAKSFSKVCKIRKISSFWNSKFNFHLQNFRFWNFNLPKNFKRIANSANNLSRNLRIAHSTLTIRRMIRVFRLTSYFRRIKEATGWVRRAKFRALWFAAFGVIIKWLGA